MHTPTVVKIDKVFKLGSEYIITEYYDENNIFVNTAKPILLTGMSSLEKAKRLNNIKLIKSYIEQMQRLLEQ